MYTALMIKCREFTILSAKRAPRSTRGKLELIPCTTINKNTKFNRPNIKKVGQMPNLFYIDLIKVVEKAYDVFLNSLSH